MIGIIAASLLTAAQDTSSAPVDSAKAPPPKTEMKPKTNVDPGIQLPPNKPADKPVAPSDPKKPVPDATKPQDDSVKPVPAAPSEPGKPGVRPL